MWKYKLLIIIIIIIIVLFLNSLSIIALSSIFNIFIVLAEASDESDELNKVSDADSQNKFLYKLLGVSFLVILVVIIMTQGPGPIDIDEIILQTKTASEIDCINNNESIDHILSDSSDSDYHILSDSDYEQNND